MQTRICPFQHRPCRLTNTRRPGNVNFASTTLNACEQGVCRNACHRFPQVRHPMVCDRGTNQRPFHCGVPSETTTAVRYVDLRAAAVTAESLQLPLRCETLAWCLSLGRLVALPSDRLLDRPHYRLCRRSPYYRIHPWTSAHGARYLWKRYISRFTCIACVLYHDTPSGYLLSFSGLPACSTFVTTYCGRIRLVAQHAAD